MVDPSDNSGQASRPKPGPKNIDWLKAKTLYLAGLTPSQIGPAVGCRREEVSRRVSREHWKAERERLAERVNDRVVDTLVERSAQTNEAVLSVLDQLGEELVEAARSTLALLRSDNGLVHPDMLTKITAAARGAAMLRRSSRGITRDEGLGKSDEDRTLVLEIRRINPEPKVLEALPA